MKTVIVKGFLYCTDYKDKDIKPYYTHYPIRTLQTNSLKLIGQCNFEVEVPEDDDITPITVLADDAEFSRLRASINHDALDLAKAIVHTEGEHHGPIVDAAKALIAKVE